MASIKTMIAVAVLVLLWVTLSIAQPGVPNSDCIGPQGECINHGDILLLPRNNYCRHIICSNGRLRRNSSGGEKHIFIRQCGNTNKITLLNNK
ncbi:hypothetical protein PoB_001319800 [Plakobranchus ocellatus]|uniref:Uncharacterized protein n=1 Tax=Plakobranchus ocellatus TaxID=259542 RepID=A0AAV3YWT0_9GAST|nr:hypothetical protein PoB_001319800 [Plakobranchus ocellatus]